MEFVIIRVGDSLHQFIGFLPFILLSTYWIFETPFEKVDNLRTIYCFDEVF